jgi:serine/threonine protein kinase/tetratricopeptide (TPR) repeat protein
VGQFVQAVSMTPERWRQIEDLYHLALEREQEEREELLATAEPELRREVESLLAVEEGDLPVLEAPGKPLGDSTVTLVSDVKQLSPGIEFPIGTRGIGSLRRQIGPYEFLFQLGRGGMGEVYRARDRTLGREVAIKVLPAAVLDDPEQLRRFRREAQLLASLNHPNIATVHGLEESGGLLCLVMELVPGQTLAERMSSGPLPVEEALPICSQIAEALEEAHGHGITHRDIKPANIKVTPAGRVKVLDFGLAKTVEGEGSIGDPALTVLTQPGLILGTPAYMSPEQLRGEAASPAGDIWAFGCVMYELLVGSRAFPGTTLAEIIVAVLKTEPDWACLPHKTPGRVRDMLRLCLQRNSEFRLPTITEARIAIEAALRVPILAPPPEPDRAIQSLAVLPFSNGSGDSQNDYLSDGLTESIIFSLSQLPQLRVMARGTVFRFKGQLNDPQGIGRSLNVGAVLTGRVSQWKETLHVSAELIDVEEGWQLWGAQYRKCSGDILAVEEEIAKEISEKLRLRLTPENRTALAKRYTENVGAYHLYLKGRFYWGKRTEEALNKANQYFRQAIEVDPTYALAYGGLAEGYIPLAFYGHVAPRQALPKAQAAAQRALEIDPALAEAQTVLSSVKCFYECDLLGAEEAVRKAIAMDPNYSRARQGLAETCMAQGRSTEAFAEIKLALELDPLSLAMHAAAGMIHYYGRDYDGAIEFCRRAVEMEANFFPARWILGLALEQKKEFAEAAGELRQARSLSNHSANMIANLGGVFAAWGKESEARSILHELDELATRKYVDQGVVAGIFACLGDKQEAFARLERAHEERCCWLYCLKVDPRLDSLRGEERFQNLVREKGLQP